MTESLYLINPRSETPTYFGAEVFEHLGYPRAHSHADLATTTVAALAPQDWKIEICDDHFDTVDFDHPADFIGITGKVTQERRMIALADEFRRRGKTVILGGPFVSLAPHLFRDHCDSMVVGELESIAEEFFSDLAARRWKPEYTAERPELDLSPLPRWDLYNNERALLGCVQTSRGCPFECEFCDVIQYLGRKQRHKSVEQVLAELDLLYDLGYRAVFLADDNLTVYRKRAKELLAALRDWNMSRKDGPVAFGTQVSIDASRDPELMDVLAESGMIWVFIGLETPNVDSLKETKKRQNVGVDLIGEVNKFLERGISVIGGMIVGFDNDGLDIFQCQLDFAMTAPIPIFTLGALVAPNSTPLYDRMEESGRLVEDDSDTASTPWNTNIIPSKMTSEELVEGLRWLCNQLYRPENFARRMHNMIESLGPARGPFAVERGSLRVHEPRGVEREAIQLLNKFVRQSPEVRKMSVNIFRAMSKRPWSETAVMVSLFRYAQVRCLYEIGSFWEPHMSDALPFETSVTPSPTSSSGNGLVTLGG